MLKWAIIFAIVSVIAGVLSFTGISAGTASVAKLLFFLFVAITVILIVVALTGVGAVA